MLERVEFSDHRVTLTLNGVVTYGDLVNGCNQIIAHPEFEVLKNQICLFESVNSIHVSAPEIKRVIDVARNAEHLPANLKIAIVSDSKLVYGLGRMYGAYAERTPWETRVFSNIEETEEWLHPSS